MKPSLFKQQNLNAKQKAILMYWQKTKGVYVRNNSVALEKVVEDKYLPPFTETESELMVDYDNVGELLESYMWTHILDAITLADMSTEKHYAQIVAFVQIVTFGMPCAYFSSMRMPEFENHNHKYFLWALGKSEGYEEGLMHFTFHTYQFVSRAIQAIMLNIYMDNVADPLASHDLLAKAFSLDKMIDQYIESLDGKMNAYVVNIKRSSIVDEVFEKNKLNMISESEKEIRTLFQPLEVFDYVFQNKKLKECGDKTLELIEKSKLHSELD